MMKKGANTDRSELKIGGYKLLTGAEKIIGAGLKSVRTMQPNRTREESLPLKMVFDAYIVNGAGKNY